MGAEMRSYFFKYYITSAAGVESETLKDLQPNRVFKDDILNKKEKHFYTQK